MKERSLHRHNARGRGVPGKLISQISTPQGVKVNMIGVCSDAGGIVAVHTDGAFHFQGALQQFRASADNELLILRRGLQVNFARALVIERQVADLQLSIDHW